MNQTLKQEKKEYRIAALLERDGDCCFFCDLPLGDDITFEHLTPVSRGGGNLLDNLVLAHIKCNQKAGGLCLMEKIKLRECNLYGWLGYLLRLFKRV